MPPRAPDWETQPCPVCRHPRGSSALSPTCSVWHVLPPQIDKGFDPIMQKHRECLQATMEALMEAFPGVGLCLFLFDAHAGEPRANYISNTDRRRTLSAIKEWVARQEANPTS